MAAVAAAATPLREPGGKWVGHVESTWGGWPEVSWFDPAHDVCGSAARKDHPPLCGGNTVRAKPEGFAHLGEGEKVDGGGEVREGAYSILAILM